MLVTESPRLLREVTDVGPITDIQFVLDEEIAYICVITDVQIIRFVKLSWIDKKLIKSPMKIL